MGEHQCPTCGHITTGLEDQDFKATRNAVIEECARAVEAAAAQVDKCNNGVFYCSTAQEKARAVAVRALIS